MFSWSEKGERQTVTRCLYREIMAYQTTRGDTRGSNEPWLHRGSGGRGYPANFTNFAMMGI